MHLTAAIRRPELTPAGPLAGMGPALRACLLAGFTHGNPVTPIECFADELREILKEGLGPIALTLLGSQHPTALPSFGALLQNRNSWLHLSLIADATLRKVGKIAADSHIKLVIIKGPTMSQYYPEEWPRYYSDLDIIVQPSEFGKALHLFGEYGYECPQETAPPWVRFYASCREGVNLHGAGKLDLHHHVPPWVFGQMLTAEKLIASAQPLGLRGSSMAGASPAHSLVIAGLHVLNDLWKGKRGISSWRDVIVLYRYLGPETSAAAFDSLNLAWLHDMLTHALEEEAPELGMRSRQPTATPSALDALRLNLLGWSDPRDSESFPALWAARLPIARGALFLAGTAVPRYSYVQGRFGSYREYWRRAYQMYSARML